MKFPRPKILLIDFEESVVAAVSAAGYSASAGTFGRPYRVPADSSYEPVIVKANLPNYSEQEVIIVNLRFPKLADEPEGERTLALSRKQIWAPRDAGVIDPRPKVMNQIRKDFGRIYDHGGVFIVFAEPRLDARYVLASKSDYSSLSVHDHLSLDNWSFLWTLDADYVRATSDHGREMGIPDDASQVASFLAGHLAGAEFTATLHPTYRTEDRWITLAHNKYEQPVACWLVPEKDSGQGSIIVLPHLRDPAAFLVDALGSFLPFIAPRLFPHAEGAKWVFRSEYELPEVLELRRQIEDVAARAREETVRLEAAIEQERASHGYLHDLLTQTGEKLVVAVRTAFEALGLRDVRDVDAGKKGGTSDLREDLQVHDRSPLLLVEVKGINGLPKEANALQIVKYIAPRMKETKRFDIQGLSVINHQRNLPALDRQNVFPFQPDVLTNAADQGFGLLTTWDLYRLVRNAQIHSWSADAVAPVLYRTGRIEPIPEHFRFLGRVDGIWPKAGAIGLRLEDRVAIEIGNTVAVEGEVDFLIESVSSLRVDDTDIAISTGPAHVGMKTARDTASFRDGMRVFLVAAD